MEDKTRLDLVWETVKALRMNSWAYLSHSYVISTLLFTLQPTSWTVIVSAQCPLSLVRAGCLGERLFVRGKWTVSSLSLRDSAVTEHHMLQTCDLQRPSTPPPSCCAPIKAELIKPQLIASAGGGMRKRKKRGGGNYKLAFSYHIQHIALDWQLLLKAYASHLPITFTNAAAI